MKHKEFSPIIIRKETAGDLPGIYAVNQLAFEGPGEAQVVDQLREGCDSFTSIVAEVRRQVVGHILFTPVRLISDSGEILDGMGLAPLAVHPAFQNQGIGKILCEAGLEAMEAMGVPFVVVLGHSGYYPRFGFEPAYNFNLRCAYPDVPPEAFMIKVFLPKVLKGVSGVIRFRPEFDQVT